MTDVTTILAANNADSRRTHAGIPRIESIIHHVAIKDR
jgi:hypothetical protein